MNDNYETALRILKKYNQEHLLLFYDSLADDEKDSLLNQILSTNFEFLLNLYQNTENPVPITSSRITPIQYYVKNKISSTDQSLYNSLGTDSIKNGELAVLTLAGGQGSRLGYSGPKGAYEIDVPPKKSLFEFTCDKLHNAFKNYNVYISWYIMTSPSNHIATISYFEKHNYFGYPKNKVHFFLQSTIPLIGTTGQIHLDTISSIKTVSNGNGDVFNSFANSGLIHDLDDNHIKWISISGIDNIILDIVDPTFLGLSIKNNSDICSKSIAKTDINSPEWVFANIDNSPGIINPSHLPTEKLESKNSNGKYNYNQMNILAHLYSVASFKSLALEDLPYHRAFKKNDYINDEGMKIVATSPNSYKFEKFIFDSFSYSKNFTLLEVDEKDEFAPIKAFTGDATPETALELYLNKCKKYGFM